MFVTVPASMSACVTVYVAVHVIDCVGARPPAGSAGQVTETDTQGTTVVQPVATDAFLVLTTTRPPDGLARALLVSTVALLTDMSAPLGRTAGNALEVVESEEDTSDEELYPLYEFEPSGEELLDTLLPRYVNARIFNCLLQAAASELAARQRAMKSAGDNAGELINKYTRQMNNARQAEVTTELTEIVSATEAL